MKKVLLVHNLYRNFGGEDAAVNGDEKLLRKKYDVQKIIYDNSEKINFFDFINFLFLTNPKSNRLLEKIIKESKPDIIYIHNLWFKGSLGLLKVAKRYQIPIVLKIHNFRYLCSSKFLSKNHIVNKEFCPACGAPKRLFFNKYFEESYIKSFFSIRFSKKLLKLIKNSKSLNILLLTEHHKNILLNEKIENKRIFIMPNYIENSSTTSFSKEDSFLYAGRISNEKGVKQIIETFLKIDVKTYILNIIGTGPQLQTLKDQYKSQKIIFHGFMDNKDVINEIKKAKVVISATKLYEGQPTLLCEATMNSVPVIFPNSGGINEFLPKNYKFLYEQFNYTEMQKAMVDILTSDHYKIGKENKNYLVDYINEKSLLETFALAIS